MASRSDHRYAQGVVGHHPFDLVDAVVGEVRSAAAEEGRAGSALLVGQDLGVGQSRVVIDQRVHVVVAELAGAVAGGLAGRASQRSPSTASGDAAELLDVYVQQLARPGPLVADGAGGDPVREVSRYAPTLLRVMGTNKALALPLASATRTPRHG